MLTPQELGAIATILAREIQRGQDGSLSRRLEHDGLAAFGRRYPRLARAWQRQYILKSAEEFRALNLLPIQPPPQLLKKAQSGPVARAVHSSHIRPAPPGSSLPVAPRATPLAPALSPAGPKGSGHHIGDVEGVSCSNYAFARNNRQTSAPAPSINTAEERPARAVSDIAPLVRKFGYQPA